MRVRLWFAAVVAASAFAGLGVRETYANCYASGVKITGVAANSITVRYVLNENADGNGGSPGVTINVRKVSDNSIVRTKTFTSADAESRRGIRTWTWDKTDGVNPVPSGQYYFEIITLDDGYVAWTQIVGPSPAPFADSTFNNFEIPRGVAVNRLNTPGNEYFGRIYVSQPRVASTTAGRACSDGIYELNADFSDTDIPGGTGPKTGGINWTLDGTTSSAAGPFKLFIPADSNSLYITDWSDAHSGLWIADPEVATATEVIDSTGRLGTGLVTGLHGSIPGVHVEGTGANRKIYTMDEDLGTGNQIGSIWRYDIGTTTTTTTPPVAFYDDTTNNYIINGEDDIVRCNDGTFYVSQVRQATGTSINLFQVSADGTTVLWRSVPDASAATETDKFWMTRGIGYDPLNNLVAAATGQGTTGLLTYGKIVVMNATTHVIVQELYFTSQTANATNCDCCFDAAGNLYVTNRSAERLRWWSPNSGVNTFTTKSANVSTAAPSISAQPQNKTVCIGSNNVQFSVTATGSGTLSYLWYKGTSPLSNGALPSGTTVAGATTATLTLSNVQAAENGATFKVDVTDVNGTTTSNTATLALTAAPVFTTSPYANAVTIGQSVSFTGIASGNSPTYQWYKAPSTLLPGQTTTTLTINPTTATSGGNYFLRATDACAQSTDSSKALLIILPLPCGDPFTDTNADGVVDMNDFGAFQRCYGSTDTITCGCFDRAAPSGTIDQSDFAAFITCASAAGGHRIAADPNCDGTSSAFSENFDADHSASWTTTLSLVGSTASDANYFFDYNTVGIPSAPHSTGGTTRGMRLRANFAASGPAQGLSVSPNGQSFNGNYTVQFDLWQNYNPAVFQGGNDSTQFTGYGVGSSGTFANVATGTADCVWFGVTGDGQNGNDYRAYDPAHTTSYPDNDPTYAAGSASGTFNTRNAGHPYYASVFGGTVENNLAPAAMVTAVPTGAWDNDHTDVGCIGYRWRTVKMQKISNYVLWFVDGRLLAAVDTTASGTLGGTNITFGQSDTFANSAFTDPSTTAIPQLLFGLVDNITVTPN